MTMNWAQLLSAKRLGQAKSTSDNRTQFQRDYDRLIFSSPFRRLQNKTQVFPLPGSIFVHNRLTHSLEVASVGQSLGSLISDRLIAAGEKSEFISEIGSIVAAACLAHDLGNPPFGHSGEDAIKQYFLSEQGIHIKEQVTPEEWADLTRFDGNANAFRMLSHQFHGRREGGFSLTYSMLASIVKYPYEAIDAPKDKFGFFQSEKEIYQTIANELGIEKISESPEKYARHPLVYLVEAADDICYQLMDLEDAHKLKIITFDETCSLFKNFYHKEKDAKNLQKIDSTMEVVTDPNEQIAYLRAGVISKLVFECVDVFMNNYDTIMLGSFKGSLINNISETSDKAMQKVQKISFERIYADRSVLEIELAGYKIISTLLNEFTQAVLNEDDKFGKKLLKLFPNQFITDKKDTYSKIQSVIDFVTGMTDVYALDLYRKITGINIPGI